MPVKEGKEIAEDTPLMLYSPSSEEHEHISEIEENLSQARKSLYISYLVAKFTEFTWQFCLIIFLTALTGYKSLTLVSTYGLFTGLVACYGGPSIGRFVDSIKYSRIYIAKSFIGVQNLSVVIATLCCFVLLRTVTEDDVSSFSADVPSKNHIKNFMPAFNATSLVLLIAIHIFGAIAKLTDTGMTVAMERDWIVVMSKVASYDIEDDDDEFGFQTESESSFCEEDSSAHVSIGSISVENTRNLDKGIIRRLKEKTWLAQTNTAMKQIDLLCTVGGPAIAGIYLAAFDQNDPTNITSTNISHWHHLSYAAMIMGILNLISLYVELVCIEQIYDLIPFLADRPIEKGGEVDVEIMPTGSETVERPKELEGYELPKEAEGFVLFGSIKIGLPRSLSLYFEQPISPGGFALALL
jgi:hypothetical protein